MLPPSMIYLTAEFFASLSFFGSAENYFTAEFFTSLSFFGSAENILRAILETCYTATGQRKKPPHAIASHLCLHTLELQCLDIFRTGPQTRTKPWSIRPWARTKLDSDLLQVGTVLQDKEEKPPHAIASHNNPRQG